MERIAGTPAQEAAGVKDSVPAFFTDTIESGHGYSDPTLARVLATRSADAVAWLKAIGGVDLAAVTLCGGHSAPRTHHEAPRADGKPTPVGWDIISALRARVDAQKDVITVRTNSRVTRLLQDETTPSSDGAQPVRGVAFTAAGSEEEQRLEADAVVLATGGFSADHTATSLLAQFAPQLACLPTTNGGFAQGDGVKIARAAGAYLKHMDMVQVHPTGFVDPADPTNGTKFLCPEAARGCGGLLLNQAGKRFVNELGRRDDVSAAMYAHCCVPGEAAPPAVTAPGQPVPPRPVHAYLVLSPKGVAKMGPNFNFYHRVKGFFKEVAGVDGLAAEIARDGVTGEVIRAELRAYSAAAGAGRCVPADLIVLVPTCVAAQKLLHPLPTIALSCLPFTPGVPCPARVQGRIRQGGVPGHLRGRRRCVFVRCTSDAKHSLHDGRRGYQRGCRVAVR